MTLRRRAVESSIKQSGARLKAQSAGRRPIALLPESGPDHLSEAGAFECLETELESALRSFPPKRTFSIADLVEIRTEALIVHRGSPAVSRVLLTGFAAKPSVLRGRSRTKEIVLAKAPGLTLVCRNVKVMEKGTALTILHLKENGESIGRP